MKKLVRICNIFLIIALLFNLFIPISFGNIVPENTTEEKVVMFQKKNIGVSRINHSFMVLLK